ncbi:MAG: hypothetical protein KKH72_00830 [Alphaproteobacteria bacterium]|nr:hypothetical protein [Alphaproteobacteria bacterium]
MRHRKSPGTPHNRAAQSLAEARHRLRVVKSRKLYTRRIKHQNRDRDPGSFVLVGLTGMPFGPALAETVGVGENAMMG